MEHPVQHDPKRTRQSGTAIPARYVEQRARVLSILRRWESPPAWVMRRPGRETGPASR